MSFFYPNSGMTEEAGPSKTKEEKEMKRKILWLVVSGLMALSLVMAACAPAATPTTPTTTTTPATTAPTTKPVEEPTQKEAVAPAEETPQYGGVLNVSTTS